MKLVLGHTRDPDYDEKRDVSSSQFCFVDLVSFRSIHDAKLLPVLSKKYFRSYSIEYRRFCRYLMLK